MDRKSTNDEPGLTRCRRVWVYWLVTLSLTALLSTGCGRPVTSTNGDPERNSYFQKAKQSYELGDYPAAAGLYQKALQAEPQLARAHLELGLLYDERLGDPITAIYHYRQFLEWEPKSDKRQLVEDFIERAKLSLASKLPQSPVADPADVTRLQNEKAALMQENGILRSRVAELERAAASVTVPAVPPVTPTVAIDGPLPGSTINSSGTPADISKARTHTVQKGDTLQSLSLK